MKYQCIAGRDFDCAILHDMRLLVYGSPTSIGSILYALPLCRHSSASTNSRCPSQRLFPRESACQWKGCNIIIQTARHSARLGGEAKEEQRRGACELSEGSSSPDNALQTGSTGGEKEEVRQPSCLHGNCAVDTAITSSSRANTLR